MWSTTGPNPAAFTSSIRGMAENPKRKPRPLIQGTGARGLRLGCRLLVSLMLDSQLLVSPLREEVKEFLEQPREALKALSQPQCLTKEGREHWHATVPQMVAELSQRVRPIHRVVEVLHGGDGSTARGLSTRLLNR